MKRKQRKIGVVTPKKRCRFCFKEIPIILDVMHAHVLEYHLQDLSEIGVSDEELEAFQKGYSWELMT